MKASIIVGLAALGFCAAGCQKDLKSTRTFRMPQGDAAKGNIAFVALKCVRCHTVDGVELPKPTESADKILALGGKVSRLRTYGDLLTSIIHPDASLSPALTQEQRKMMTRSPMPPVNDEMTVQQLIDLLAFIQPRYVQLEPLYDGQYQSLP